MLAVETLVLERLEDPADLPDLRECPNEDHRGSSGGSMKT